MEHLTKVKKLLSNRKIVLTGILALIVGVYIWWSISFWSNYEIRQVTFRQEIKSRTDSIITLKTETKEQRVETLSALKSLTSEVSSNTSLCTVNSIVGWQRVFGNLRQREQACKGIQADFSNLHDQLELITHYLEEEHHLAQIMSTAPVGGEVSEADFDKKLEGWKAVSKAINDLDTDSEVFNSVTQKARESVKSIVDAWQEVVAAHQARDKSRYIKAEKELAAAHDTLDTIAKTDEEKLQALVLVLDKALKETRL